MQFSAQQLGWLDVPNWSALSLFGGEVGTFDTWRIGPFARWLPISIAAGLRRELQTIVRGSEMHVSRSYAVAATFAAVALAVGCAGGKGGGHNTTSSAPTMAPTVTTTATTTVAPMVAPTSIDSLILAPDVIGEIVGTKFNYVFQPPPGWTAPLKPLQDFDEGNPDCQALLGPNTNSVGATYTAWRSNDYQEDKHTKDHVVGQAVATVTDPNAATQLLDTAFAKFVNSCDNAVIHPKIFINKIKFQKTEVTDTDVRWTSTELKDGQITGRTVAYEARAKNNVVIFVSVGQNGNGAPTAATILNKISEKIPG